MNNEESQNSEAEKVHINNFKAEQGSRNIFGGNYTENQNIITENRNTYEATPTFSALNFEESEDYPEPQFMSKVYTLLLENKVLLLFGNSNFDQGEFAEQLAKKVMDENSDYTGKKLIQNEKNESLSSHLKSLDGKNVVLLNNLHPRNIKYDLSNLLQLAASKNSYYIITTEITYDDWDTPGNSLENHWFTIPEVGHFHESILTEWFIERLNNTSIRFLDESIELKPTTILGETITISTIVTLIPYPQKLTIFINNYNLEQKRPTDVALHYTCTNLNKGAEEILAKWFNNLTYDQKIIALCVALFNGIQFSQFFEILQQLVNDTFWKISNESLIAIDYHNLTFIKPFCRYEKSETGTRIISQSSQFRSLLLKVAKSNFSRHLEMALRVFMNVTKDSYEYDNNINWELYGTVEKRGLIRMTFISAARDIGINNLINIEPILLELASTKNKYVKRIAGKALGQYRAFDQEELLFSTIERWLTSDHIEQRMALLVQKHNDKNKFENTAAVYVKSTVIHALSEAADYDRPNHLDERIIDYLLQFSEDPNMEIRYALSDALPKFIHHHSSQLKDYIFKNFMPKKGLKYGISLGLIFAYEDYPSILKSTLINWLKICTAEATKNKGEKETSQRENTLTTILTTLTYIDFHSESGFSIRELYEIAIPLLKEKKQVVLKHVVRFIAKLQIADFELAYEFIPSTIHRFPKGYRNEIIKSWAQEYLDQRKQIPDNPYIIIVEDEEYPAWSKLNQRPLIPIEKAMFTWINSNSKTAKVYATLAFLEFAKIFEYSEYKQLKLLKAALTELQLLREIQEENVRKASISSVVSNSVGIGVWLRVRIFFYLLFETKENKVVLREIIKLFLNSSNYSNTDLQLVILKWRQRNAGDLSNKLAKWLDRFM